MKRQSVVNGVGRSTHARREEGYTRQLYLFPNLETYVPANGKQKRNLVACEWKIVAVRASRSPNRRGVCTQPLDAFNYWRANIATGPTFNPEVECFAVLILNTGFQICGHNLVSIGSINQTIAEPREVFRAAVISAAYGVVLMHNHPCGNSNPSNADTKLTRKMVEAGKILGIQVTDHVIVGSDGYFSFREAGII